MKQCIKYFMIILLGVLLYDGAAQAAGISCTLISNDSERCFLSQAPTSHQQNIRNIYNHFSSMPLYMDNVDMCMQMRGVEKQNSITTTSDFTGAFNQAKTREEFMNLIRQNSFT